MHKVSWWKVKNKLSKEVQFFFGYDRYNLVARFPLNNSLNKNSVVETLLVMPLLWHRNAAMLCYDMQ